MAVVAAPTTVLGSIPSPSSGRLELGPLSLNAYGLMIALGVVAAVWLFGRRLEERHIGTREDANAIAVWGVIAGKSLAVVTVVFLQSILLGAIGFALGWRPHLAGLALGAVIIALGTAGFAALGLLLGGTLRSEIVLALANLLWFVFAGLGALTLEGQAVPTAVAWAARLTPSGALTECLSQAMTLSVDWFGIAVLATWGTVAAVCALRWFRFT